MTELEVEINCRTYSTLSSTLKQGLSSVFKYLFKERGVYKMKSERSDVFSNLKFTHYDRLHTTPEAVLSTENKSSNTTTSTAVNTHVSEKGIIFALGFIATLLFFSGLQLYRCVNLNPIRAKATTLPRTLPNAPDKAFAFKTKNSTTEIPAKKINRFVSSHRIETRSIQNSISHGKF